MGNYDNDNIEVQRKSRNQNSTANKKKIQKRKRKRKMRLFLSTALLLILFLIGSSSIYIYHQLSKVNHVNISKTNEDLGIKQNVIDNLDNQGLNSSITNIALFGLDARNPSDNARSDSIMIATLDYKHKKLKITSLMRDTYVNIDGHGKDKITNAYGYGGAQLAIKTLNENFDLNIRNFMTINFYGMEDVIDSIGGVNIDVKQNEIAAINPYIKELCNIDHKKYTPITKAGPQLLNGRQAVNYARIRSVGNSDFERTERQRRVLNEVFKGVMSSGKTKYPEIVSKFLPLISTSMSSTELLSTGTKFFTSGISEMQQARFPLDGYCADKTIKHIYYLVPTMPITKDQMYKYIFEDIPISQQTKIKQN